jgi:hypothetical protein
MPQTDKKPRVSIPTNVALLLAVAEQVLAGLDTSLAGVDDVDKVNASVLGQHMGELTMAIQAAKQQESARLGQANASKLSVIARDLELAKLVGTLRDVRDSAFVQFQDDYSEMTKWGFTILPVLSTPATPPEA